MAIIEVIPWNIANRAFTIDTGSQSDGTQVIDLPKAETSKEASILTHTSLVSDGGAVGNPGTPAFLMLLSTETRFLVRVTLGENIISAGIEATDGTEPVTTSIIWTGRMIIPDAFNVGIDHRISNPTANNQDFILSIIGHVERYG